MIFAWSRTLLDAVKIAYGMWNENKQLTFEQFKDGLVRAFGKQESEARILLTSIGESNVEGLDFQCFEQSAFDGVPIRFVVVLRSVFHAGNARSLVDALQARSQQGIAVEVFYFRAMIQEAPDQEVLEAAWRLGGTKALEELGARNAAAST